jgi:hypothetical protein
MITWIALQFCGHLAVTMIRSRIPLRNWSKLNAKAWHHIGVDVTRSIHDPVNHWMGGKIANWIRFFGVNPDDWEVTQGGNTAWISKRPFQTLSELEKNMPKKPVL